MRYGAFLVSLLLIVSCLLLVCHGCSSTTDTSTTTTTTAVTSTTSLHALYVETGKAGAVVASGTSYMGQISTNMSGGLGASSVHTATVRAQAGGPPDGFFNPLPASGYFAVNSTEVLGGNLTPYMRIKIVSGAVLSSSLVVGKIIASVEGATVKQQMCNELSESQRNAAFSAWISSFESNPDPYNSSLFQAVESAADYTAWSYMYPTMETMTPHWPRGVHLFSPEAANADLVSSMECRMVFSNSATGEIIVNLPVDRIGDPRPAAGAHSGSGNLLLPDGSTLEAVATMTMVSQGEHTTEVESIIISGTTTPEGFQFWFYIGNPITTGGSGNGLLSSEAGTLIATIEVNNTGGYMYFVSGSRESFTY